MFEKGQILRKIWICFKTLFDQTSKMEKMFKKKIVILLNVSHIQINYAFLLFWSILGEIHRKNLFLVKKVTFSERSIEKLRNLFNLILLERVNPEENLDLFKQLFLIKPVKGDTIKKKIFSSKWAT